jgi:hypothetical protein
MKIAYNALGISETGKPIVGHVFFDSKVQVSSSHLTYSILAYHFLSDSLIHSGSAPGTDRISTLIGPTPDVVVPGNGVWLMGAWATNTGVLFQAVDNTVFATPLGKRSDYEHLPARIELSAAFASPGAPVAFRPKGFLKLIWDPQFATARGLGPGFYDDPKN